MDERIILKQELEKHTVRLQISPTQKTAITASGGKVQTPRLHKKWVIS
jgi:hypothetical protein